ncbi:cobalt ECF transporter T component CbiQ [Geoalkalibacter halelectricus]|uniref:Cobalt ECF transporter T component CbiQ n=1 Tax=Geoalkalibacter halelectricus TaxID=2847045 RepID=A0ABY5ZNJ0_9BACT|nr:cobalt ECF transporter T component CbiQ [Geoalkalibacter halelectricus]MDO3377524.1 cobalt ECF transporter T component CbiQ [Geoalkalibacter halelectricus]UWZ80717.1 cobalt ECF transporter T component CbiQ [Geoalkalibacter halelectricus]
MSGAHHFIDAQGDSRRLLVALDGRIKLVLLVAALIVNLTAGGLRAPLLLFFTASCLVAAAGVPMRAFARRMAVPALIALVALVTQLFWVQQGTELLRLPLLGWEWSLTSGALLRGLELAVRILGGMGVLLFFALTTPLPELLRAARFFRCPPVLVELAMIMYRYIFLLLEEGVRIRNAQKSRLGFTSLRAGVRSSGILGGMLILRTFDRAERNFAAMLCRGYQGALTGVTLRPVPKRDWLALTLGLLLLLAIFALR